MPFDFLASYGDFEYGPDGLNEPVGDLEKGITANTGDTPGRDGGYGGLSFYDWWGITISGSITPPNAAASEEDQRAAVEARLRQIAAAHSPRRGQFRRLRLHSDALFLFARPLRFKHGNTKFLQQEWECAFQVAPFYHAETETIVNLAASGNTTVTNPGTADALPRLAITLSAAPAGATVTITNTTTGNAPFILRPDAPGLYTAYSSSDLDTDPRRLLTESVQREGEDVSRLRSGPWLRLVPGGNVLSVAVGGGAALAGGPVLTFRARFE